MGTVAPSLRPERVVVRQPCPPNLLTVGRTQPCTCGCTNTLLRSLIASFSLADDDEDSVAVAKDTLREFRCHGDLPSPDSSFIRRTDTCYK